MPGGADAKLLHNAGAAARAARYLGHVCETAAKSLEELELAGVDVSPVLARICAVHDPTMALARDIDGAVLALIEANRGAVRRPFLSPLAAEPPSGEPGDE